MANGPQINPELLQALLQLGSAAAPSNVPNASPGTATPTDVPNASPGHIDSGLLRNLLQSGSPQIPTFNASAGGPEQMSQQGQFNPAAVQAQFQGGPEPPFSFAPVQGGIGRQILNALAQAGKAATYVAEDPRERMADQARAQQLWETKQKMSLAAGEFGQREKDRQLAQQQLDIYRKSVLGEKSEELGEKKRAAGVREAQGQEKLDIADRLAALKENPKDKTVHFSVDEQDNLQVTMQRADGSLYDKKMDVKVRKPPEVGKAQPIVTPSGDVVAPVPSRTVSKVEPGSQTLSQYGTQPERVQKALKPYQDTLDTVAAARDFASQRTGPGDYAFMMQFIGATKPEELAKIRLNTQEINLVKKARGFVEDVEGWKMRLNNGELFPDTQRKAMLDTLAVVERAAQRSMQRVQTTPGMTPQGGGATAPAGKVDPNNPLGLNLRKRTQ